MFTTRAIKVLAIAICFSAAATYASAESIPIVNGDFEDGDHPGDPRFPPAASWDGHALWTQHSAFGGGFVGGGDNFAFTLGSQPAAEQTLSDTYAADTVYTLSANLNYGGSDNPDAEFSLGYDDGGGFVAIATDILDLDGVNDWSFIGSLSATVDAGNAAVGQNIILRIQQVGAPGTVGLWMDNVTLDGTLVPEPTSLALAFIGLAGVGCRAKALQVL